MVPHRVWNRVYILRVRFEIGYGKSYILVWNRVRVFRTGRHTPTQKYYEYPPSSPPGIGRKNLLACQGDQTQNEAKKVPTQPRKPKPATSQNAKHPNPDGRGRKDMTSVDKSKRRVKLGDEQGPSGISEKELKDLAAESPNENVKKRRRSDKMQGREMKTPKAENESSGKRENLRKRRKVNYSDSVAVKNEKNGESSESERVENAESSSGNGGETRREGSGKKRPSRTPKTRNFRKQSLCSDSPDTDSDFEEGSHRRDLRSQKAAASVNHRLSKPQAVDKSGTSKTPQRKRSVGAKQAKQTPIRESVHPEGSGSDSDFVETTTPVPRRCGPSASSAGTSLENSKGSFSKNTTRGDRCGIH